MRNKIIFSSTLIRFIKHKNYLVLVRTNRLQLEESLKVKISVPATLKLQAESTSKNSFLESKMSIQKMIIKNKELDKRALIGTLAAQLANMVFGLYKKHSIKFQFIGVGYKASLKKNILILRLGLSHKLYLKLPESLSFTRIKKRPPTFMLKGNDLNIVKSTAYLIRSFKKPEPYKGKGIVFLNEFLKLKEGKKTKN
jgi:large subunit ribosomal protein L6